MLLCSNTALRGTLQRIGPHFFNKYISGSTMMENKHTTQKVEDVIACVQSFVPVMTNNLYKGQCGRIGVVGGCKEYTGAPYFAAISALKLGADLSHVFCVESAASVIKSYSPELIVHPVLDAASAVDDVSQWLPRLHSIVFGPGLGRDPDIYQNFKGIMLQAMQFKLPMIIDADGVYFITQDPSLIKGYSKAILTPNGIEFIRLYEKVCGKKPDKDDRENSTQALARELEGVTIVCKGETDVVTNGTSVIVCSNEGSPRRCGGQGDLLSGSMGTFLYWAYKSLENKDDSNSLLQNIGPNISAAYGACYLTRECNKMAFSKHKRSMTTSDMINYIGEVFANNFEPKTKI